MKNKIRQISKKKLVKGAFALVVVAALFLFFILPAFQLFQINSKSSELKNYYLAELEAGHFSPDSDATPREKYYYGFFKVVLHELNKKDLPEDFHSEYARNMEALFYNKCSALQPELCDPYEELLPYCNAKFAEHLKIYGTADGLKSELKQNKEYKNSMDYWEEYIHTKELKEGDISAILGYSMCKIFSLEMDEEEAEELAEKVLEIEINDLDIITKTEYLRKKRDILIFLDNLISNEEIRERSFKKICNKTPSFEKIEQEQDVCTTHNYYQIKLFCGEERELASSRYYALLINHLKERHEEIKKAICQLELVGYLKHLPRGQLMQQIVN